jgi:hypothetical protein
MQLKVSVWVDVVMALWTKRCAVRRPAGLYTTHKESYERLYVMQDTRWSEYVPGYGCESGYKGRRR